MYTKPQPWTGRIDGTEEESLRWHQKVELADIQEEVLYKEPFFGILGFASDEGVRRNKGRVGAKTGPKMLRKFSSNFPANSQKKIIDFGTVGCEDADLEKSQSLLSHFIEKIQIAGGKTIVLGGGHEVMYAHYSGLRKAFPDKKIGIINFDAHFDNRPVKPEIGATSGTGFWQIAQNDLNYNYLAIGIQENSNTKSLFDFAQKSGTEYILAKDFQSKNEEKIKTTIVDFIAKVEIIYLTVCLDVFAAPFAPGVSAVAYNGLIPDSFFQEIFHQIVSNQKLIAFDIAELNPDFDIDNRTARLAASLLFEFVKH
jgi:formiminoglutamase